MSSTEGDAGELRALLRLHEEAVVRDDMNEFIDQELVHRLYRQVNAVLDRWAGMSDEHRALVARTVEYLANTDDEEHDIRSPIGFVDDAERVEGMLAVVAPDLLS